MAVGFELRIDPRRGIDKLKRDIGRIYEDQLPFAIVTLLNDLAVGVQADLETAMEGSFDRPTPYTLRAFYIWKARKNDLHARVATREFGGTLPANYLGPEVIGGPRKLKRFERALAGVSGGQYVVPASGAVLDQYGNISRGQIMQILSQLGLMGDQNASSKTTNRLAKKKLLVQRQRGQYFVAKAKDGGKPRGIYKLVGQGKVVPVLWFMPASPNYSIRLKVETIANQSIRRRMPGATRHAFRKTMLTMRR